VAAVQTATVEARKTGIPMLVIFTAPSLAERAREQASQYGNLRYRAKPANFHGILGPIREMIERASPSPS
jgi:hypothetical protein